MNDNIKQCPHCGAENGLYSKEYVHYEQYYTFDGESDGFGELSQLQKRKSTPLYCSACEKKVTTLEKLQDVRRISYNQCAKSRKEYLESEVEDNG